MRNKKCDETKAMYYNIIVDIVKLNKKYPTCNCFFIIIKRDRKIKLFFLFVFYY